jgi:subtilisin family serine protease
MRKGIVIGALVFVLAITTIIATRPRDVGEQRINTTNDHISKLKTTKPQNQLQIQKVDMLHANHVLKTQLNNSPEIKLIHHNTKDKSHYYDKEVIVNFKVTPTPGSLTQMNKEIDGLLTKQLDSLYMFKSNSKSTDALLAYFRKNENVEFAEPHYIFMPNEVNDTYYQSYQWNLPAVGTEEGWTITRGSKKVKIAVVDTGVDLNHPDLSGKIVDGYNALDPKAPPIDDNGHGTHVAGIIAADSNNGQGVAGITWYNPIIPVKVMNAKGHGGSFDIAQGIRWAVDHGANVINLSLGNYQICSVMEDAINYAVNKDVVVISAAGNDNTSQPSYPAAFPGVLGVAAVDYNGNRAQFSNYGDYVDVAAPGVDIPSTYANGQYAALSGTSMAAPHVTALAGLIRSINPNLKSNEVLDMIIHNTQKSSQATPNPFYGNGIIDNGSALQSAYLSNHPKATKGK